MANNISMHYYCNCFKDIYLYLFLCLSVRMYEFDDCSFIGSWIVNALDTMCIGSRKGGAMGLQPHPILSVLHRILTEIFFQ